MRRTNSHTASNGDVYPTSGNIGIRTDPRRGWGRGRWEKVVRRATLVLVPVPVARLHPPTHGQYSPAMVAVARGGADDNLG
jgi:hypothetical protein